VHHGLTAEAGEEQRAAEETQKEGSKPRIATLELFFDLVFVFTIIEVSSTATDGLWSWFTLQRRSSSSMCSAHPRPSPIHFHDPSCS